MIKKKQQKGSAEQTRKNTSKIELIEIELVASKYSQYSDM